ncbi:MAG: ATP-binding protein [Candidatus Micrarchaeaceae archaeon]
MSLAIDQSHKVVIVGQSGSGKTYLGKWLFKNLKMKNKIAVDPVGAILSCEKIGYCGYSKEYKAHVFKLFSPDGLEKLIKAMWGKEFYLFLDEADSYIPLSNFSIQSQFWVFRWLKEGRNFREGGILISQLVGQLNKQAFTNSQYLVQFNLNNVMSVKYLRSLGITVREKLPPYHFMLYDLMNSQDLGVYTLKQNKLVKISN